MSHAVLVAPTAPDPPLSRRTIWLIGPGAASIMAARRLRERPGVLVKQATLAETLESARAGDLAILVGLSPQETVEGADRLLNHAVTAAVDVTDAPALRRALGQARFGGSFVMLRPRRAAQPARRAMRIRDVLVAAVGLSALTPLFGVLAVIIKRTSPGPVFFATTVVGRDGRTFTWRKLRTMRVGAPADDLRRREAYRRFLSERDERASIGVSTAGADARTAPSEHAPRKLVDERRVTPIGRFLRRHSIDELPQLWNVLRGDMTLVGPRPCLPYEYELQAPWHRRRFRVTPGLTGPWQAYGRSTLTFDEMALLDYCYGQVTSFWLDARLILRTALVVLTGEGGK